MYQSHRYGELVINSIWLLDDWRSICLKDKACMSIESQFLWGRALLVSPALSANQTQVKAFFPAINSQGKEERWFEFSTGEEVAVFGESENQWQTLDAPLDYLPLHVRGGFILPMQAPQNRTSPYGLSFLLLLFCVYVCFFFFFF
ncbi:hypothetical protein RFI_19512 [Reticulomyxa filosa]|uniref:Glycosyl hydrolase family 31 C-terminal domain-containing protein n=1 Tax=Reticulomyxa filosa TaxID=46433 RepID=X6MVY9_RETFI|nr:hypothetical protein RFI_19512 [Reticulomyxa filosa]|eukprot:ETO17801.1 hypothetical protein RFI_19512 [Reticulomyxa filosa]